MKYCPYCGADLIDGTVSFCAECGKQLPTGKTQEEKSNNRSKNKETSKKKKTVNNAESSVDTETVVDDGYDGYYDDVRPIDEDREQEGVDKEIIKKIAVIIAGLFVVIVACVALMYVI